MTDPAPLENIVEALLFLSPEPVSVPALAEACDATEAEVDRALDLLAGTLAAGRRGVVLREVARGFSLAAAPAAAGAARRLLAKPRTPPLTQAQAETLAIVDAHLASQMFLAGDRFTMGDIALGCGIWRWMNLPIERSNMVNVARWFEALTQRPAYRKIVMHPLT